MTQSRLTMAMIVLYVVLLFPLAARAFEDAPLRPQLNGCSRVKVRKEYRDMTREEWADFASALKIIEPETDRWTRMHLEHVGEAHGVASFFPWHRLFLLAWEDRLSALANNPNLTIPYWDWSSDWSDPLSATIFSLVPVAPGPRGDCRYRRSIPRPHCLTRNYTASTFFSTFYSHSLIDRIIAEAGQYERLWRQLEPAPHGIVHAAIGGEGGDMTQMHSPNDPIFWLHHANLDRMWAEWQGLGEPRRLSDYSGSGNGGRPVKLTDTMSPFHVTAADAVDYHRFCYTYQPYKSRDNKSNKVNVDAKRRVSPGGNKLNSETAVDSLLPQPLPEHFLMMHGMNASEVREHEAELREMMRKDLSELEGIANSANRTKRGSNIIAALVSTVITLVLLM